MPIQKQDPAYLDKVKNEVRLLRMVKGHPNVTAIDCVYRTHKEYIIVMEHVRGRDLRQLLKTEGAINRRARRKVIHGVLQALKHLRTFPIEHGDIKPQNVIVGDDYSPTLIDFGVA